MISIILTWTVITVFSYVIGRTIVLSCYRKERETVLDSPDISVLAGISFMAVLAQTFSIFSGVGAAAFLAVAIIFLICLFILIRKRDFSVLRIESRSVFKVVVFSVLGIIALMYTNMPPQHYDTYLYHAQAIRWIEEYGLVPGLGNLHFRLAYNSAFMSLQALFSFKWLLGQSLHTLNGLITVWMIGYSVFSSFREREFKCSDMMKMFGLLYVLYDGTHISSPNTDTFALLLVYYIFIKWMEFSEKEEKGYRPYALLCVLAVFATTLKLSAGIVVILMIFPLIKMIKERKVFSIFKHLGMGILLLAPFFVRSFLISGYFLYPYEASGFIDVDWKMPAGVLEDDKAMIIAWGRGNLDVSRNSEHLWQWVGEWFSSIEIPWKILIVLSVISIVFILVQTIVRKDIKKTTEEYFLYMGMLLGLGFWLLTAPLPRYGAVYMIGFVAVAVYMLAKKLVKREKSVKILVRTYLGIIAAGYLGIFLIFGKINGIPFPLSAIQSDYENKPTHSIEKNGIVFGVPVAGDQTGYDPFPTTLMYSEEEITVNLRGTDLPQGFSN